MNPFRVATSCMLIGVLAAACASSRASGRAGTAPSPRPVQNGPPVAAPPPYAAPPPAGPPQPYPPAPTAGPPPAYPTPPAAAPPSPPQQLPSAAPRGSADPIQQVDIPWLRERAHEILTALIAALPESARSRVAAIPFVFDPTPGEVNAFAACTDGKPVMAITDGLLDIAAHLALAKAIDDVYGTGQVNAYIGFLARNQRPHAPVVRPPPGFFDARRAADPRVLARQYEVLDEQLAFVLGHELAHHHLGHLPCTGRAGPLGTGDIARALSSAVPLFNQPNEVAADVAGTNNVLIAGSRRTGYRWTEGGGLLTMRFFSGLDQTSPIDILFAFERSHPPPELRIPIIQQTANTWRLTGGAWLPIPGF